MIATTPSNDLGLASDDQLVELILQSHATAFEELFRRHRDVCYRVAYRLLNHEADALDCVQESFVKAYRNLDKFRNQSSLKTWLLRIVSNTSFDAGRKRQREEMRRSGTMVEESQAEALQASVDQELVQNELRQSLDEALKSLPKVQREAFVWHVDGELSYKEIAELQEVSVGTVMSRLFYARKRLKHLLADQIWN